VASSAAQPWASPAAGPPLVFQSDGVQLRAQYRYNGLAVEHAAPDREAARTVALRLDALAELEGRDEGPIALEAAGPGRNRASWADRGVPRSREYEVGPVDPPAAMSAPATWSPVPEGLLDAPAEAALTAGEASPRYALDCVRLGGDGSIAATDGRQLLVQRGFPMPGTGYAIVRLAPLFAGRCLPRDRAVELARIDGEIALRVGPRTIRLESRSGVRFPDLGDVIPPPEAALTRRRRVPGSDARPAARGRRAPYAGHPRPQRPDRRQGPRGRRRAGDGAGPGPLDLLGPADPAGHRP
jgi:hypothetical protein